MSIPHSVTHSSLLLAAMNGAAMNASVQTSVPILALSSFVYIPRNGLAGSDGNFLKREVCVFINCSFPHHGSETFFSTVLHRSPSFLGTVCVLKQGHHHFLMRPPLWDIAVVLRHTYTHSNTHAHMHTHVHTYTHITLKIL